MPTMFALCLAATPQLKRLEDRILFGDEGAMMFDTEEDAHAFFNARREDFRKGYAGTEIVIEKVTIDSAEHEYRVLVRLCDTAPSEEVRREMEKLLENDWRTRAFCFKSTEENAGAMCRALFWAEGITPHDCMMGKAIVKVQRRKPDTRDIFAKKLSPALRVFEDIGGWDVFGIEYMTGR
jgi:hypothetical protein